MADTKIHVECPACGKEMTKVFIPRENIYVDVCTDGCGGIFFDNREFEKFDEKHESVDEIVESLKGKVFQKPEDREIRICPVCELPMSKLGAANGDIQIDVCNTCGSKFLDYGELEIIRESSSSEKVDFDIDEKDVQILGSFGSFVRQRSISTGLNKKTQNLVEKILRHF